MRCRSDGAATQKCLATVLSAIQGLAQSVQDISRKVDEQSMSLRALHSPSPVARDLFAPAAVEQQTVVSTKAQSGVGDGSSDGLVRKCPSLSLTTRLVIPFSYSPAPAMPPRPLPPSFSPLPGFPAPSLSHTLPRAHAQASLSDGLVQTRAPLVMMTAGGVFVGGGDDQPGPRGQLDSSHSRERFVEPRQRVYSKNVTDHTSNGLPLP